MPKIRVNNNMISRKIIGVFVILTAIISGACSNKIQRNDSDYYNLVLKSNSKHIELDTGRINEIARDYVIKGSALEQQGRFAEAILDFQQALKYDSAAAIDYAIAKCYLSMYKINLSEEFIINALQKDPLFIPAMDILTEIYIIRKRYQDAITIYKKIVELEPLISRKFILAKLYEYNNTKMAIELYEDISKNNETNKVLNRLAKLYEKNGDTLKQISVLNKLMNYSDSKIATADVLIKIYLDSRNYENTFKLLTDLDNTLPSEDLSYFYNISAAKLLNDTIELNKKYIPQFLDRIDNRFYFDWRINLLSAYLSNVINDSVTEEKFINRTLKSDTIPDIPLAVASYYLQTNKNIKIIELLDTLKNDYVDNQEFYFYMGTAHANLKDNRKALTSLNHALKIDSSNLDVWGQLGLIYDRLKIYDSCDYAYKKILNVSPDNPLINNNYAYSLSERNEDLDKALEMSSKALKVMPNNASYLDTYGWIQYRLGKYELALEYVLKAVETGNINAELYEHLGYIYLELGDLEKAKEAWQTSLSMEPDNMMIADQLELLMKK